MKPRLSHSDYDHLLDLIAELQQPVSSAEFGQRLLALSAPLLPGAIVSFDQIHNSSGQYLFDHSCPIDEAASARLSERLGQVYTQNPIYDYIRNGGTGPVVRLSELISRREFHQTDFYRDIFKPFGIEHQLCVLVPRDGWIITLTINSDREIPQRVTDIFHLAARHISIAHQAVNSHESNPRTLAKASSGMLTPRESEVFHWLQEGKRNSEIAMILGCSPRTVDKHVEHILFKADAETRTAAARTLSER
jgi:DNA-binding CsgD family transcriptional regulator